MAYPALLQKAGLGMPQYPVASQNAYTPAQLLHSRAATQGLQFLGRAYCSRAWLTVPGQGLRSYAGLTVPGQGLQFPGRAYGSWAGLTVSGHSDVPLSGLGRWMACPALLQKAVLGMPQYPVASQNAYTPAQLLHSNAAAQILSQCRCNGGHKRSCCAN